ncbi:DUF5958 family protein [Spirosoma koreense]
MTRMSLDEEVALYRFGQGVNAADELLGQFRLADWFGKRIKFFELDRLIMQLKPTGSEIDQALVDSGLTDTSLSDAVLKHHRSGSRVRLRKSLSADELESGYRLLMALFKQTYQRHRLSADTSDWHYWDLSNPETIQAVLIKHRTVVDEVYNNPSFRSEFVSMAKLWHDKYPQHPSNKPEAEPVPELQTHFEFVGYDEIITLSIEQIRDKTNWSMAALHQSVEKALAIRYGLDQHQANRVLFDVMERHIRETYHTGLF